jgi:hypothetical protein
MSSGQLPFSISVHAVYLVNSELPSFLVNGFNWAFLSVFWTTPLRSPCYNRYLHTGTFPAPQSACTWITTA